MNKKGKPLIFLVIGIIAVAVIIAVSRGNHFRISISEFGRRIEFQTLDSGVKFKTPVGADVTLTVVSDDVVTVKTVEQDGKDTIVRISPVAKK